MEFDQDQSVHYINVLDMYKHIHYQPVNNNNNNNRKKQKNDKPKQLPSVKSRGIYDPIMCIEFPLAKPW